MIEQGVHTRSNESFVKANGEYVNIGHGYVAKSEGFHAVQGLLEPMVREYPASLTDAFGQYPHILSKYCLKSNSVGDVQVLQHQTRIQKINERGSFNLIHQYASVGEDAELNLARYPLSWMQNFYAAQIYNWREFYVCQQPTFVNSVSFPLPPLSQLLPQFGMDLHSFETLLCALYDAVRDPRIYIIILFNDALQNYELLVKQLIVYIYLLLPYSMRRICGFESWLTGSMSSDLVELYFTSYRYAVHSDNRFYVYISPEQALDVSNCFLVSGQNLWHQKPDFLEREYYNEPTLPFRRFIHPWLERIMDPQQCFSEINRLNLEYWEAFESSPIGKSSLNADDLQHLMHYQQLREDRFSIDWNSFQNFASEFCAAMGNVGDEQLAAFLDAYLQSYEPDDACIHVLMQILEGELNTTRVRQVVENRLALYFSSHTISIQLIHPILHLVERGLISIHPEAWQLILAEEYPRSWENIYAFLTLSRGYLNGDKVVIPEDIRRTAVEKASVLLPDAFPWDDSVHRAMELSSTLPDAWRDRFVCAVFGKLTIEVEWVCRELPALKNLSACPQAQAQLRARLHALFSAATISLDATILVIQSCFSAFDESSAADLCAPLIENLPESMDAVQAQSLVRCICDLFVRFRNATDLVLACQKRILHCVPLPVQDMLGLFPSSMYAAPPYDDAFVVWLAGCNPMPKLTIQNVEKFIGIAAQSSPALQESLVQILNADLERIESGDMDFDRAKQYGAMLRPLSSAHRQLLLNTLIDALPTQPIAALLETLMLCVQIDASEGVIVALIRSLTHILPDLKQTHACLPAVFDQIYALYHVSGEPAALQPVLAECFACVELDAQQLTDSCNWLIGTAIRLREHMPSSVACTVTHLCGLFSRSYPSVGFAKQLFPRIQAELGEDALLGALRPVRIPTEMRNDFFHAMLAWNDAGILSGGCIHQLMCALVDDGSDASFRLQLTPDEFNALYDARRNRKLTLDEALFSAFAGHVRINAHQSIPDLMLIAQLINPGSAKRAKDKSRLDVDQISNEVMSILKDIVTGFASANGVTRELLEAFEEALNAQYQEGAERMLRIMLPCLKCTEHDNRQELVIWVLNHYGRVVPGPALECAQRLLEEACCVTNAQKVLSAVGKSKASTELYRAVVNSIDPEAYPMASLNDLMGMLGDHPELADCIWNKAEILIQRLSLIQIFGYIAGKQTSSVGRSGSCKLEDSPQLQALMRNALLRKLSSDEPLNIAFTDRNSEALLEICRFILDQETDKIRAGACTTRLIRHMDGYGIKNGGVFLDRMLEVMRLLDEVQQKEVCETLLRVLNNSQFKLLQGNRKPEDYFVDFAKIKNGYDVRLCKALLNCAAHSVYLNEQSVARDQKWLNSLMKQDNFRTEALSCCSFHWRQELLGRFRSNNSASISDRDFQPIKTCFEDENDWRVASVQLLLGIHEAPEIFWRHLWKTWENDRNFRKYSTGDVNLLQWGAPLFSILQSMQDDRNPGTADYMGHACCVFNRILRDQPSAAEFLLSFLASADGLIRDSRRQEEYVRPFLTELIRELHRKRRPGNPKPDPGLLNAIRKVKSIKHLRDLTQETLCFEVRMTSMAIMNDMLFANPMRRYLRIYMSDESVRKSELIQVWISCLGPDTAYAREAFWAMCSVFGSIGIDAAHMPIRWVNLKFPEEYKKDLLSCLPADAQDRIDLLTFCLFTQLNKHAHREISPDQADSRVIKSFDKELQAPLKALLPDAGRCICRLVKVYARCRYADGTSANGSFHWDECADLLRYGLYAMDTDGTIKLVDIMFAVRDWSLLDYLRETRDACGDQPGVDAYFQCVNAHIRTKAQNLRLSSSRSASSLNHYLSQISSD